MKPTVIALGFFDGVHRGHGALLRRTVEVARQLDAITALQFDRLNEMLVVKGLNDPAHCYLE